MVDLGTGSGLLAIMAGTAGADSVVACELHESLCNTARQVMSHLQQMTGLSPSYRHSSKKLTRKFCVGCDLLDMCFSCAAQLDS